MQVREDKVARGKRENFLKRDNSKENKMKRRKKRF
jgi:hypothetical protein